MTVLQAIHSTAYNLSLVSTENPHQEARWMLEAIVGKDGCLPPDVPTRQLTEEELRLLHDWTARRDSGEPLQYLLGTTEFRCLTLKMDRRALIPRPETEGLVELALEAIQGFENPSILDVGTGSGAIALSLLSEHPGASAIGCDISSEALELAKENGQILGLNSRITWTLADLFALDFHNDFQQQFDLIVSNPPYVSESEFDDLPTTVRDWEPKLALVAGEDGLQAIRRLAQVGKNSLKRGGWLVCEIGELQGQAAKTIFKGFEWDAIVKNDLSGKPRFIIAKAI